MKAISLVQPYAFIMCVSKAYQLPIPADEDYRGKVLICAGKGCEVASLAGLVEEHAMCVANLTDIRPLTDEEKAQLGDGALSYLATFENPKLVAPFSVEQTDGFFDVVHDIEYIGSEAQFKEAYNGIITPDTPLDVLNAYAYISDSYFAEAVGGGAQAAPSPFGAPMR